MSRLKRAGISLWIPLLLVAIETSLLCCGCGGGSGPGNTVTQSTPVLSSITVSPASVTLIAGQTQQLSATAKYSDGSTKDVTSTAIWASSSTSIATVSNTGMLTSIASGNSSISATASGVSGSITVQVNAKTIQSLAVTPVGATFAIGIQHQFVAAGTYNDSSTGDVTDSVSWSSSNPQVASVSSSGLVAALAPGTAEIVAASGGVQGSTSLVISTDSGGLVLSTNPTDEMIVSGIDSNGAKVSFYGTRDSNGVPQAITQIQQLGSDGTQQVVSFDAQGRPIYASDSRGALFNLDWASSTQGVVTAVASSGASVFSAPFTVPQATAAIKSPQVTVHRNASSPKAEAATAPSGNVVEIEVSDSCTPPVPESMANVQVTMETPDGTTVENIPVTNNGDGTYNAMLPSPTTSIIGNSELLAEELAAQQAQAAACQNQGIQQTSTFCTALAAAAALLGVELPTVIADGCTAIGVGTNLCSASQRVSSWLDPYTNYLVNVSATASTYSDLGVSKTQLGIWGKKTFDPFQISLNCRLPASVNVVPDSLTLSSGQGAALHADLFDANNIWIRNSAFTASWQTSDPNVAIVGSTGFDVFPTGVNPGGATITASATSTVTGTEISSSKSGTSSVTVNGCPTTPATGPLTSAVTPTSIVLPLPTCDSTGNCSAQGGPLTYTNTSSSQCPLNTGLTASTGSTPTILWQGYYYDVSWTTNCGPTLDAGKSCQFVFSDTASPTTIPGNSTDSTTYTITIEDNASQPSVQVTVTPL